MTRNAFPLSIIMVALTTLQPAWGQTQAPTNAQLKSVISVRRQRVDFLRAEITKLDSLIESRLDDIVDTLKTVADSPDSRTKVARMKEDTLKGLMKMIDYYSQKRAALIEQLRKPSLHLTDEEKRTLIAALEARIDTRTKQVIALYKSMPAHQEYERYKVVAAGGWWGTEYQRNVEFEQDRRITSHTNSQRAAIVKQLDDSIARLQRQSRALNTQIAATANAAQRQILAGELADTDALIAERRQQRIEVMAPSVTPTHTIALKKAMDMDKALQTEINELRSDFTTLFQRYNTYLNELSTLHVTEAAYSVKSPAL